MLTRKHLGLSAPADLLLLERMVLLRRHQLDFDFSVECARRFAKGIRCD
jgi:hypothetical protein